MLAAHDAVAVVRLRVVTLAVASGWPPCRSSSRLRPPAHDDARRARWPRARAHQTPAQTVPTHYPGAASPALAERRRLSAIAPALLLVRVASHLAGSSRVSEKRADEHDWITAESYGFQGIEGALLRCLGLGGRYQRPPGHLSVESRDQSRTGARSQELCLAAGLIVRASDLARAGSSARSSGSRSSTRLILVQLLDYSGRHSVAVELASSSAFQGSQAWTALLALVPCPVANYANANATRHRS